MKNTICKILSSGYNLLKYPVAGVVALLLTACTGGEVKPDRHTDTLPAIFPDYTGVTVPPNMVAPRFWLPDSVGADDVRAVFTAGDVHIVTGRNRKVDIGRGDWQKLIAASDTVQVTLSAHIGGEWVEYAPFNIYIAPDEIDPYIAYRLIEPGYETWNEMGLYQRCLENYDQSAIITNRSTGYGCMNCHSFHAQDPAKMLFHMRVDYGGTYLINGKNITKLNTKTPETISALVYPSWHPSGKYVAFSVNNTKQMFHTTDPNRIEVMDYASDVVVYDVDRHEIVTCPQLFSAGSFETFPTFSADGKTLYFCSADSVAMPEQYDKLKYHLCSISFDPGSRSFGSQVDTLFVGGSMQSPGAQGRNNVISSSSHTEDIANQTTEDLRPAEEQESTPGWGSASFPRVSPDGKRLMMTLSGYGNFSIWHHDADLYMIDLVSGDLTPIEPLNSPDTESYHSWSSNGRWVVFSSRRGDGLYTRPYIAYVDEQGRARKPFILPPESEDFYALLMKSYNVPEFCKGRVPLSPTEIADYAKSAAGIDVGFSIQK